MGAEKINLDELLKARQELNQEYGITTPEPKKTQKETNETKIDKQPVEESSDVTKKEENKIEPETDKKDETTFNLDDDIDIETEVEKYISSQVEGQKTDEAKSDLEPNNELRSKIEEISDKVESDALAEEEKTLNDLNSLIDSLDFNGIDEEDKILNLPKDFDEEVAKLETESDEKKTDNLDKSDITETNKEEQKVQDSSENKEKLPLKEVKTEENVKPKTAEIDEKTTETTKKSPYDDDFEFKPIHMPKFEVNLNKPEEKEAEKKTDENEQKNDESEKDITADNAENKDAGEKVEKTEESNEDKKEKEDIKDKLKKIQDSKFINLIRSKSFMSSDSLTCIYGTDEEDEVFCQNFRDFYNTAIFCEKDENIFEMFSSVIMSLLLKNTKFDVKFAICDAKNGSPFTVYNNLSYMFFDRVAESNREIVEALKEICHEIDDRYRALAKVGTKSIENFNAEMKKAKVAPLPYLILFFNNYTRAYNLDDSNEINNNLSYILRFGRLVGVYVNLVSFDENLPESINYNLQTRIAYKADMKETSISELGEEGAEKIVFDDEFILKTLYSDKLIHLKAPKITQKEIELLIKNIEKK